MICRSSDIFYRFGNTTKKRAAEIEVYENSKLRNKLHQMHSAKTSFLMVYVGTCDCYENIKMKL